MAAAEETAATAATVTATENVVPPESAEAVALQEGASETALPIPAHVSGKPASARLALMVGVVVVTLVVLALAIWFFAFRAKPEEPVLETQPVLPAAPTSPLSDAPVEIAPPKEETPPAEEGVSPRKEHTPQSEEERPQAEAPAEASRGTRATEQEKARAAARERASKAATERSARTEPETRPAPRTCNKLSGFPKLICQTEGPTQFWRCAPDGVNWNNNLPGCQRSSGRDSNLPY